MWKCEKCNEYRFNDFKNRKRCYCKAFVIVDEDGDEYEVQAINQEDAALKYARESNEERDHYLAESSVDITVDGTKFTLSAYPDFCYIADEITE